MCMKKNYITPVITEQGIQNQQVLCASGGGRTINSNTGFNYNDEGGDATTAF